MRQIQRRHNVANVGRCIPRRQRRQTESPYASRGRLNDDEFFPKVCGIHGRIAACVLGCEERGEKTREAEEPEAESRKPEA